MNRSRILSRLVVVAVLFLLIVIYAVLTVIRSDDAASAKNNSASNGSPKAKEITMRQHIGLIDGLIEGTNQPINFWAKVLDQDGKPISGVLVNYSWSMEKGNGVGALWSSTQYREGSTTSNANGSFSVTGIRGHIFNLNTLTKSGYRNANTFGAVGKGEVEYNFDQDANGHFTSDKSKPLFFYMVLETEVVPLITNSEEYDLPADERPLSINIWKGKSDPSGELRIVFKREPLHLTGGQHSSHWEAKLEMIGGGILENARGNNTLFLAPENGYQETVAYPSVEQEVGRPEQYFYFRTSKGNFGRLEIKIRPDFRPTSARCDLTIYLNPNADNRNLEYDKTKEVQK